MNILQVITVEEHEALVRVAIDRATKIAEADFMTRLIWRCGVNGMNNPDQHKTFDALLLAFEKHLTRGAT